MKAIQFNKILVMAKAQTLDFFSYLVIFVLLVNVPVKSSGLTIRMIHSDILQFPLLQRNLTHQQIIPQSLALRPYLESQSFHYIVRLGIGTFNSRPSWKEYYFDMDTCSNLVWTQCQGCTRCFKQTPKPFPKQNSSSYRPIRSYSLEYSHGDKTSGTLARETFHLRSDAGGSVKIENLEFGCGMENLMEYGSYRHNMISGVIGMGWGTRSFVNQIHPYSNGKFSYCLPISLHKTIAYLRFGNDIAQPRIYSSTPLQRVYMNEGYYVEMVGISVDGKNLNVSEKTFALRVDGRAGGCLIDSRTSYSTLITSAFLKLKFELEKYFSRFSNLKKYDDFRSELCYQRVKSGEYNLPSVTFHFKGPNADFVMKPESLFGFVEKFRFPMFREAFCLAMVKSNLRTVIGAYQQKNQRMIFDTKKKQLIFHYEDCARNP